MHKIRKHTLQDILKIISQDRERTNILRKYEQAWIAGLVKVVPSWISSDMLTAIGFAGNVIVFLSFVGATFLHEYFLLLSPLGFTISWFGDSLDGRIAYYRKKPRKWYGFALDFTMDWASTIIIGLGFVIYADDFTDLFGFLFVVLYGWEMLTSLLRYRITGKYSIDAGIFGPTEVRIMLSVCLVIEALFTGSLFYISIGACVFLLISNIIESNKLLRLAHRRDLGEKIKAVPEN